MVKILLVEDDKSLREIYGVRLQAEGYEIVSAGDGEEALAMAIKERPDLIVSDVMMPKISGFDMLDILRSTTETKNVKVIMMTALSSEEQRARGEALGADRYLVKSQVGIEDVVRTVHEVLSDGAPTAVPTPATAPVAPPVTPPTETPAPLPVAAAVPVTEPVQPVVPAPPVEPIQPVEPIAVPEPPVAATPAPVVPLPAPEPAPAPAPLEPAPLPPITTEATEPAVTPEVNPLVTPITNPEPVPAPGIAAPPLSDLNSMMAEELGAAPVQAPAAPAPETPPTTPPQAQ